MTKTISIPEKSNDARRQKPNFAPTPKRKVGAILVCLIVFVLAAGCSVKPAPVVIRLTPPEALAQEQPFPEWTGETNADLLEYTQTLESALDKANATIRAIFRWGEGNK